MIATKKYFEEPLHSEVSDESQREKWPDVFRGVAIIAVVTIHSTGHVLSRMSTCNWDWYVMASVNRLFQCAVPAFLLVSAYLNGVSLRKERSHSPPVKLILRRLKSIGIPYALTSGVGVWASARESGSSFSFLHFLKALILGRGAYHLYFIILIAQLYMVLPLALRLFDRPRRLLTVILAAAGMQGIAFVANRIFETVQTLHGFRERFPSISIESSLLWYILPIALGLWLVAQPSRSKVAAVPKSALYVTLAALLIYLPLSVLALVLPVATLPCQAAVWTYTASASFLLVYISSTLSRSSLLTFIGRRSLTIYLAHPFVIEALDAAIPALRHLPGWVAAPIYICAAVSGCLLLSTTGSLLRRKA